MSTRYQAGTSQANAIEQANTSQASIGLVSAMEQVSTGQASTTDQISASQANNGQVANETGSVALDSIPRNGANHNQIGTEYGSLTLELNQNTLERHIVEAKIQLNIARDQLRTLAKANRDLIAGNVTSYVCTGNVTVGGVLYAVIESKLDFGTRLGRYQFNGSLGGLPVGVNGYSGGAEFFLSPDQMAALGTIDIQVDATPAQCFIYWRHNTRILGAFYGTGSGASGVGAIGAFYSSGVSGVGSIGNGTFKQLS
ncbi:MAG TPA: hypothetical protein VF458_19780 [Ktedonobacteraceae bacterium]